MTRPLRSPLNFNSPFPTPFNPPASLPYYDFILKSFHHFFLYVADSTNTHCPTLAPGNPSCSSHVAIYTYSSLPQTILWHRIIVIHASLPSPFASPSTGEFEIISHCLSELSINRLHPFACSTLTRWDFFVLQWLTRSLMSLLAFDVSFCQGLRPRRVNSGWR